MGVERPFTRLRPRLARAMLAISVLALVVVPPVAISNRIRRHERYLATVEIASARLTRDDAHRLSLEQDLAMIREFDATRPLWIPRIATIAVAIPPSVFVTSFRADSSEIELTIIGSDVGTIPEQIARLTPFGIVDVVGAITHELVDGQQLQRVTLRGRPALSRPAPPVAALASKSVPSTKAGL